MDGFECCEHASISPRGQIRISRYGLSALLHGHMPRNATTLASSCDWANLAASAQRLRCRTGTACRAASCKCGEHHPDHDEQESVSVQQNAARAESRQSARESVRAFQLLKRHAVVLLVEDVLWPARKQHHVLLHVGRATVQQMLPRVCAVSVWREHVLTP